MTTQQAIADRLGVSQRLVAYALNGNGRVGKEARERILAEAERVGYRTNRAARMLATGRSDLIALWTPLLLSPFYARVTHTFEVLLKDTSYDLMIAGGKGDAARTDLLSFPLDWNPDGILAIEAEAAIRRWVRHRRDLPPIVSVGAYAKAYSNGLDYVSVDLEPCAAAAIEHFLQLGCRRIAYLAEEGMFMDFEPRYRGAQRQMRSSGGMLDTIEVPHDPQLRAAARQTLTAYVRRHGCPDGLLCGNDDMAIGAYRALLDLGRRIPDDVALIGCDGIPDAEYLERPLSTIVQPTEAVCRKAWEFLQNRIANPDLPPQQTEFTAKLVIRDSASRWRGANREALQTTAEFPQP